MNIIAADDESLALRSLTRAIREAKPEAEVAAFQDSEEVLAYAREHPVDVAFLDVEMDGVTGIEIAKQLKVLYPKVNIVFVTGHDEYMAQAIALRMSGYVGKPATREKIQIELEDLKYPVPRADEKRPVVRCFGNFEIFVKGRPLIFEKAKAKEMLAYLVDRRGSMVTSGELCGILWADAVTDGNTRSYLSKTKKSLLAALKAAGVRDIFLETRGKCAVDPQKISCDYYDYLNDRPEGVRAYNGEYMVQYSWGELEKATFWQHESCYNQEGNRTGRKRMPVQ